LQNDFVGKLKEAWGIYNQMKQTNYSIYETMKQAKSDLKDAFVTKIRNSQSDLVCKCQDLLNSVGSFLPSSFSATITAACNEKCSNSLEYAEEIDFND
jgi:hypothetical protein